MGERKCDRGGGRRTIPFVLYSYICRDADRDPPVHDVHATPRHPSSPTRAHDASVTPTGQSSVLRAHARLHERPARGAARAPHSTGRVDGVTRLQGHSATRLHLQPSARCTPRPSSIKSRRAHASVHITAKQSAPGPHRRTSGHHISGETCMTSVSGASFAVTSISCCVSFAFSLSSSSARLRAAKNLSTRASTSCCESEPTSSSS